MFCQSRVPSWSSPVIFGFNIMVSSVEDLLAVTKIFSGAFWDGIAITKWKQIATAQYDIKMYVFFFILRSLTIEWNKSLHIILKIVSDQDWMPRVTDTWKELIWKMSKYYL